MEKPDQISDKDKNANSNSKSSSKNKTELLRNIKPGEEIVISGISGAFSNADNVHELRDNLYNKLPLPSESRWKNFTHPELPKCTGFIPNIEKYDAGYFGVHARQADASDSMCRILQQKTVEAIMDAGLHPSDLENTNTGVYVGTCLSETERVLCFNNLMPNSYAWTGATKSMQPHRLSYFLKLRGPSMVVDSACCSSLYALEHAFSALMLGDIDNAIVAGTSLCLHPFVNVQFARVGVLSMSGSCNVFDETANGFVRAEAIVVIFLQKLKNAKRSYAQVIHAKTNCDGNKEKGITYPSGESQINLLTGFYEECNINPNELSYFEAHGTATAAGDSEECFAIDEVLTKNRKLPLLVGSLKSNIGHSEPASGISAVIKCILGFENGFIPPNINYNTPNKNLRGIAEGRMKVVVDKMRFEDNRGLAGVNSFGFGGDNSHVLLHWNEKINDGLPKDDLPRLVCVSGRTEDAVTVLLDELRDNELDVEHNHLLHNLFRKNIQNHVYRGYTIVSKSGEIIRSLRYFTGDTKQLYFIFSELNNWCEIGNNLMVLPVFAASIQRIQTLLLDKCIDLQNILLNKTCDSETAHILGGVAVQIGIIDILKLVEIKPTDCIGFSFGVLSAAYFDGSLTLEETISCACVLNEFLNMSKSEGFGITQAYHPMGNYVTNTDITFDGNDTKLDKLRIILKSYNSIKIEKYLLDNLTKVLGNEKLYHDKTIKSKLRSADYLINALTNNVYQESKRSKLHSIIFNISSVPFQEGFNGVTVISFATARREDHLVDVLESLGSLYECGYNPQIEKLYPPIMLPVSRGTRMISPYIKWDHRRDWFVPNSHLDWNRRDWGVKIHKLQFTNQPWSFITEHVIDGKYNITYY